MDLSQVTKGRLKKPHLVLVYGADGLGKSTFGAGAPSPLFVGPEAGSHDLDVSRLEPQTFEDIHSIIDNLIAKKHEYKTLVLDSLDWIEPLLWRSVCIKGKVSSIEEYDKGFGKGYVEAARWWFLLIEKLKKLRETGMGIVAIAHAQTKPYNDPMLPAPYDRHIIKLNASAAALWREFVDTVLFVAEETFTSVVKEGQKAKAFSDGVIVAHTRRRPSFDAKSRFNLPKQIPFTRNSWQDYVNAVENAKPEDAAFIRESIASMLESLQPGELKDKVIETLKAAPDDAIYLSNIKTKLAIRIGEQQ